MTGEPKAGFTRAGTVAAPAEAPYGSWRSPVPLELVAEGFVRLAEPRWDGDAITWLEGRAEDGGRQTLVRWTREGVRDVSPVGLNVRTRVHEYGGGAYLAAGDLVVVSDFATGRLMRVGPDRSVTPLTPAGRWRYADACLDASRKRLICVREDHTREGREAVNTLVAVPLDGAAADDPARVAELARGSDFVAAPRLSPDGRRLAWTRWNHPNMPWDGTECVVADVGAARLARGRDGRGRRRPDLGHAAGLVAVGRAVPFGRAGRLAQPLSRGDGRGHTRRSRGPSPSRRWPPRSAGRNGTSAMPTTGSRAMGRSSRPPAPEDATGCYRIDPAGGADPVEIPLPFTELDYLGVRGDRLVCLAASPTTFRSVVVVRPPGRIGRGAPARVGGDPRSRRSRAGRTGRLPDDRPADRARDPVPAAQSGRPGAHRRAAAAPGHQSRRPDVRGERRAHGLDPGPRHARDRGPRRGLRGQHGLRA